MLQQQQDRSVLPYYTLDNTPGVKFRGDILETPGGTHNQNGGYEKISSFFSLQPRPLSRTPAPKFDTPLIFYTTLAGKTVTVYLVDSSDYISDQNIPAGELKKTQTHK